MFVFVDRILDMVPGKTIRAIKIVQEDEEIFKVHYPGFPVLPGTFLVEMMAQTAGRCLDAEKRPRGLAMVARIKSAHFRKYVGPTQTAIINAQIRINRDNFAIGDCNIEVNNKKVCTAELLFTFVPFQELAPGFRDDVLESYLSGSKQS